MLRSGSSSPSAPPLTTEHGNTGTTAAAPPPAANPEATAPKASQTVHAAHLSPRTYLEIEAEVETYLASLKARLMAVLQAGQRIRIQ